MQQSNEIQLAVSCRGAPCLGGVRLVRIIAGTARGLRLDAPPGKRVRPTLDRVREALFNIIGPELHGSTFLDLFAGSGANGIEALSRGAASAVFVDNHPQSQACIRKNLAHCRVGSDAKVLRYALPEELRKLDGSFEMVFADPPYDFDDYEGLLAGIGESGVLAEGGTVVLEHASRHDVPEAAGTLVQKRQRRYGNATLSFYA